MAKLVGVTLEGQTISTAGFLQEGSVSQLPDKAQRRYKEWENQKRREKGAVKFEPEGSEGPDALSIVAYDKNGKEVGSFYLGRGGIGR